MEFQKLNIESQNILNALQECNSVECGQLFRSFISSMETRNINAPNIPQGLEWLNVSSALNYNSNLKGKLCILDFFTYCCVNCLHILPDLHALENSFSISDGLAVLGIHSAKFPNEKVASNILSAILRYDITHPVLNDPDALLWNEMDIQCWPTFVFVSPEGKVILYMVGESYKSLLSMVVKTALEYYSEKGLISDHTLPIKLVKDSLPKQSLLFPGKITSTDDGKLVVSDTGHHRIVLIEPHGVIHSVIGGGQGNRDGSFTDACFNAPQGVYCDGDLIYIADTENHTIREADLRTKQVITLTGTGHQGDDKEGGKSGINQEISSPWDLCLGPFPGTAEDTEKRLLYIAMAGTHQIWSYFIDDGPWFKGSSQAATCCIRFSGSGNEENRNNSYPHKAGFAQPSGVAVGEHKGQKVLFIADSESSSIRILDIMTGGVKACVGGDRDPMNLFAFGDQDGKGVIAKLQHPLAVAWEPRNKQLYVADSYNHKIKVVDSSTFECKTLCGTGKPGLKDGMFEEAAFNEPGGLYCSDYGTRLFVTDTNNHAIRVIDLEKRVVSTLRVLDVDQVDFALEVSTVADASTKPKSLVSRNAPVKVFPVRTFAAGGSVQLNCNVTLPTNCNYTSEAPSRWQIIAEGDESVVSLSPSDGKLSEDCSVIRVNVKPKNHDVKTVMLKVEVVVFYCKADSSVCLTKSGVVKQELCWGGVPQTDRDIAIEQSFALT